MHRWQLCNRHLLQAYSFTLYCTDQQIQLVSTCIQIMSLDWSIDLYTRRCFAYMCTQTQTQMHEIS